MSIEINTLTACAVYRNGDMIEGRGPMVLDSIWPTRKAAKEYANGQVGVMGRVPEPVRDWEKYRGGADWTVRELASSEAILVVIARGWQYSKEPR